MNDDLKKTDAKPHIEWKQSKKRMHCNFDRYAYEIPFCIQKQIV